MSKRHESEMPEDKNIELAVNMVVHKVVGKIVTILEDLGYYEVEEIENLFGKEITDKLVCGRYDKLSLKDLATIVKKCKRE